MTCILFKMKLGSVKKIATKVMKIFLVTGTTVLMVQFQNGDEHTIVMFRHKGEYK